MAAMPYIASQSGAPLLCHIEYEKSWKAVPMFCTAPNHMIWEIRFGVVFLRRCGLPI